MHSVNYAFRISEHKDGSTGRQYSHASFGDKDLSSPCSRDKDSVQVSYTFDFPWYLSAEYRRKHSLSLKDIREMLLYTPVSVLLQLSIVLGLDLNEIMAPETLTDHSWVSLQQWLAQMREASESGQRSLFMDSLFKDDTRLLTALVNNLYKYFEFEYRSQDLLSIPPKCICPFDSHSPFLPVHFDDGFDKLIREAKIGDLREFSLPDGDDLNYWICRGGFHGYQKWQNPMAECELILIQSATGHQYLQNWEAASKKRKELYIARWSDKVYLG